MSRRKFIGSAFNFVSALALSASFAKADDVNQIAFSPELAEWTVSIEGYLDSNNVSRFIETIEDLRERDPLHPIRVEIFDVSGGSIESGFNLAEALYEHGNIDLVCRGNIQSMGATIFTSYRGGERIAGSGCTNFMMHDLILSLWSPDSSYRFIRTEASAHVDNMNLALDIMSNAVADAANMSQQAALSLFGADCNLSPQAAYQLNLVDRFESALQETPLSRIENHEPEDIYQICGTRPLADYVSLPDWSTRNFGPAN